MNDISLHLLSAISDEGLIRISKFSERKHGIVSKPSQRYDFRLRFHDVTKWSLYPGQSIVPLLILSAKIVVMTSIIK